MAAVKMICRVCGKEYTACRNVRVAPSVFRWQEVACSPECGEIYLAEVIASRTPATEKTKKRTKKSTPSAKEDHAEAEASEVDSGVE